MSSTKYKYIVRYKDNCYNIKEREAVMKIENRFLKYVSFDTQSDPYSTTSPSSITFFNPCLTAFSING